MPSGYFPEQAGKALAISFFCVFCLFRAGAQDLEVGFIGGGCYYLGDLNPGKHFVNSKISYGAVARCNLDTRWAVKLSFERGTIKGNAANSTFLPDRGLSFTSDITDIAATVEFNFRQYFTGSTMNAFTPYVFTGISAFFYNPKNNGVELRSLGTEGQNIGYMGRAPYGSVGISIPFGLGLKVSFTKKIGFQVYWEMHKTFNDYLDDVSTTYYLDGRTITESDPIGIASDPTRNHEAGMQRGSTSNNDWYCFYGASLTYKFNLISTKRCRDLHHY